MPFGLSQRSEKRASGRKSTASSFQKFRFTVSVIEITGLDPETASPLTLRVKDRARDIDSEHLFPEDGQNLNLVIDFNTIVSKGFRKNVQLQVVSHQAQHTIVVAETQLDLS